MIGKTLLIGSSGLMPFYLSQDDLAIDPDLLSGFCRAIYEISIELTFPLKDIGFEKHKMLVENFDHAEDQHILLAFLFDDFHIDDGIRQKIKNVYTKFFKDYNFGDESRPVRDQILINNIRDFINDVPLRNYVQTHLNSFKEIIEPVLKQKENQIYAYSINSSNNNTLYMAGTNEILQNRPGESLGVILKEYLRQWELDNVPQGDKFAGFDLPTGLDLNDYLSTGLKTNGIVINTSINLKDEPDNEILLYFYGKNMLMRSCVPDIERELREKLNIS